MILLILQIGQKTVTESEWSGIIWLAVSLLGLAGLLLGIIGGIYVAQIKSQSKSQSQMSESISAMAYDIRLIKNNFDHTIKTVDEIQNDVDSIRKELTGIDKRVMQLEIVK